MWNTVWDFFHVFHILFTCLSHGKISHAYEIIMWKTYEYCVKTTTISHGISHVWCVNLSDRACETLCEKDNIFHTISHIVFTCISQGEISHACGISCEISVKNVNTMWKLPLFHTLFHMVFHMFAPGRVYPLLNFVLVHFEILPDYTRGE